MHFIPLIMCVKVIFLGQTSLHVAASHGNEEIVEILLQNNVDTDAKDVRKKKCISECFLIFNFISPFW